MIFWFDDIEASNYVQHYLISEVEFRIHEMQLMDITVSFKPTNGLRHSKISAMLQDYSQIALIGNKNRMKATRVMTCKHACVLNSMKNRIFFSTNNEIGNKPIEMEVDSDQFLLGGITGL